MRVAVSNSSSLTVQCAGLSYINNLKQILSHTELSILEGLLNITTSISLHPYDPALHTLCIVPIDHMTLKFSQQLSRSTTQALH